MSQRENHKKNAFSLIYRSILIKVSFEPKLHKEMNPLSSNEIVLKESSAM
jgi:hypothetical protein